MWQRLDGWLRRQNRATIAGLGLALVVPCAYLDRAWGPDPALLAYLVPVSLAALYAGAWQAAAIAVGCAALSAVTPLARGAPPVELQWLIAIGFPRLGVLCIVALVVAALGRTRDRALEWERTDAVTGIPNLRAFFERATFELARARRYTHPFTVVYIDLDGFKSVNDRFGHAAGDEMLRGVAQGLRTLLRTTDLVARVEGDAFVALLPETSAAPARLVIRKMQEVLALVVIPGQPALTCGIGAATYFTPPATVDALVQTGDALMYAAKGAGPNSVQHRTFN